jgi:membrane-associated PAP2 superfamily phosphatase
LKGDGKTMKRCTSIYILAFLGFMLLTALVVADSLANHDIPWDVVGRGGGEMSSGHYAIRGTAGQSVIGPGASASYALGAGYWYGLRNISIPGGKIYLPVILSG